MKIKYRHKTARNRWKRELATITQTYLDNQVVNELLILFSQIENNKLNQQLLIEYETDLLNIFLHYIQDIYDCSIDALNNIYKWNISKKQLTNQEIFELLYKKDGKTINQRIHIHLQDLIIDHNFAKVKNQFTNIYDTERQSVYQYTTKSEAKKMGYEYGYIDIGSGPCTNDICSPYADQIMTLDDIDEPPFHPNCNCEIEVLQFDELSPGEKEELGIDGGDE